MLVDNVKHGNDNPVYWAFDADDKKIGEGHSFMGTDAMLMYSASSVKFKYPRVILIPHGSVMFDAWEGGQEFMHRLVPSSRGMYLPEPKPIKDEDGNVYMSCEITSVYLGICDPKSERTPLYLDCDTFVGEPA